MKHLLVTLTIATAAQGCSSSDAATSGSGIDAQAEGATSSSDAANGDAEVMIDARAPDLADALADAVPADAPRFDCTKPDAGTQLLSGPTACADRPITACASPDASPQQLGNQLLQVVEQCGTLPNESTIEVWFDNGCPTDLKADIAGPPDAHDVLRGCVIESLSAARWDCAPNQACAMVVRSTLR
jgi:hypothetical protein